jgi:hypothetical protein
MRPLYLARIEDLGRGGLVKIVSAVCLHVALLTPGGLMKLGLSPKTKMLRLCQEITDSTFDRVRLGFTTVF